MTIRRSRSLGPTQTGEWTEASGAAANIVKALCPGAAVMIGRASTWAVGATGAPGVARAIEILREDIVQTMKLSGCTSLGDLDSSYVDPPRAWVEGLKDPST